MGEDFSLTKEARITERVKFRFMREFGNIFNRVLVFGIGQFIRLGEARKMGALLEDAPGIILKIAVVLVIVLESAAEDERDSFIA